MHISAYKIIIIQSYAKLQNFMSTLLSAPAIPCWDLQQLRSTWQQDDDEAKLILLMVQKSGDHQLRLVVYPIIYKGFMDLYHIVGYHP